MPALSALVVAVPLAMAADFDCGINAPKTMTKAEMAAMAKVTIATAKKTALSALGGKPGATITKGGLEVEGGCLVYSYDVRVPGKSGIDEVIVDAGSGKVLKIEHESSHETGARTPVEKAKK